MPSVHDRASEQLTTARQILSGLKLLERWSRYGRPVVVGAMACDVMVSPDIDLEVYCPELRVEHGFDVLRQCAAHPNVTKARFSNELAGRDRALYWQLRYRHDDGVEWSVDMWSAPEDYGLPRSEDFVVAMRAALTPDTRKAVLELKERRAKDTTLKCPSIDLYRAVLESGVRTVDDLYAWLQTNNTGALTDWTPE